MWRIGGDMTLGRILASKDWDLSVRVELVEARETVREREREREREGEREGGRERERERERERARARERGGQHQN